MTRKLRPLAALAMVALIGAGCSDAPDENGSAGNSNTADQEQAVKCRRPRATDPRIICGTGPSGCCVAWTGCWQLAENGATRQTRLRRSISPASWKSC